MKTNLEVTSYSWPIKCVVVLLILGSFDVQSQTEYTTGTIQNDQLYDSLKPYDLEKYQLNIPVAYSLKTHLPKVGNQAKLPHDVGWAISHAYTISENARRLDGTESANKSPFFVNMLFADEKKVCEEGLDLTSALIAMSSYGLPAIQEYAYPCPRRLDSRVLDKASDLIIHGFEKTFDRLQGTEAKANRIKRRLILDQPVVVAMHTPPSFVNAAEFWQPKELYSEVFPLHSMVIVGYDDQLYGGAFEVVNSWGQQWGNEGYMYLRYDDLDFLRYGFAISNKLDESGNYSIFNGELSLRLAENDSTLDIIRFSHRGYFQLHVPDDALEFFIRGSANKPFYLKMYYRTGEEVTRIYPSDNWHSSLFEHSYSEFDLPGDDLTYKITQDYFSAIYCFLSFENLDDMDFTKLVQSSTTIGDLTSESTYNVARLMIWDQSNARFSGRMAENEILPLLIDLSFGQ